MSTHDFTANKKRKKKKERFSTILIGLQLFLPKVQCSYFKEKRLPISRDRQTDRYVGLEGSCKLKYSYLMKALTN